MFNWIKGLVKDLLKGIIGSIIRSLTKGGISKLRECGWDILKKGDNG